MLLAGCAQAPRPHSVQIHIENTTRETQVLGLVMALDGREYVNQTFVIERYQPLVDSAAEEPIRFHLPAGHFEFSTHSRGVQSDGFLDIYDDTETIVIRITDLGLEVFTTRPESATQSGTVQPETEGPNSMPVNPCSWPVGRNDSPVEVYPLFLLDPQEAARTFAEALDDPLTSDIRDNPGADIPEFATSRGHVWEHYDGSYGRPMVFHYEADTTWPGASGPAIDVDPGNRTAAEASLRTGLHGLGLPVQGIEGGTWSVPACG